MVDRLALAMDERRDFADFLASLSPAQWWAPTLCPAWDVRRVVAHVVSYEEARPIALAAAFVRAGFRLGRVNELRLAGYQDRSPEQLIAFLRDHLEPRGLTAGAGGGIGLTDCLIHHQDIRRSLGLPRQVPLERVREALEVAKRASVLPARRNAKGHRLTAIDTGWTTGDGPAVEGPGEALLMAITGRADALDELEGAGVATLRGRVEVG